VTARVSGLSDAQAFHARRVIIKDVHNMMQHQAAIHYTQGPRRWEGIDHRCNHLDGTFPHHADCSSTLTWLIWDAIARSYHVHDLVNHAAWKAGYTGTAQSGGKQVKHESNLLIGDGIFYGDQGGGISEHTAIYIGGGHVFSHGGESGPFILPMDYRKDRRRELMRRYI
jgi:hypothetical protein